MTFATDLQNLPENSRDVILTACEAAKGNLWPEDPWQSWLELKDIQRDHLLWWCATSFLEDYRAGLRKVTSTSYGIKHYFEESESGYYITNGQFKMAMAVMGILPDDPRALNWTWKRLYFMGCAWDIPRRGSAHQPKSILGTPTWAEHALRQIGMIK